MHFLNTFVNFSHEMATNDIRTFAFYPYLWTFRNWVLKMTPNESVLISVTAVSGFSKPGSSYNIDNILKGQVKISGVTAKIFLIVAISDRGWCVLHRAARGRVELRLRLRARVPCSCLAAAAGPRGRGGARHGASAGARRRAAARHRGRFRKG